MNVLEVEVMLIIFGVRPDPPCTTVALIGTASRPTTFRLTGLYFNFKNVRAGDRKIKAKIEN
jgi:hypothetical protein